MVSELHKTTPAKDQGQTKPEAAENDTHKADQPAPSAIHADTHGNDALTHTRTVRLHAEQNVTLPGVDLVGQELKRDGSAQHYQVKKGDTLSEIAQRQLPPGASVHDIYNQVREIAKANHIANPDKIPVGMQLELPAKVAKDAHAKPATTSDNGNGTGNGTGNGDRTGTGAGPGAATDNAPPASGNGAQPGSDAGTPGGPASTPGTATDGGTGARRPSAVDQAPSYENQPHPVVPQLTPEQKSAANATTAAAIESALGPDTPDVGPTFGDVPAMPMGPITDKHKIMQLLSDKTPEEIQAISKAFADKYGKDHGGRTLEQILSDRLDGTDKSKAVDLFHRSDKADDAGRIHTALEEIHEWGGRSRTNCEKDIRDTMATMNSAQITALKADYEKRYGHNMDDDIAKDSKISDETRGALAIYSKGSDNRTPADTIALANIATKAKNLDMFQEAFRDAAPEARSQYMAQGGMDKMKTAFDGWFSDSDFRKAQDYVNSGKLDVVTKVKDNTGVFSSNDKAIDTAVSAMSPEDRAQYGRGKAVAATFQEYTYEASGEGAVPIFNTEAYNKLSAEQKTDYDRYRALHEAMQGAGNSIKVARWEDMIANKGETLATSLAQHGGMWSDKVDKALTDIEGMSEKDFNRLKQDPSYRKEVEDALSLAYSGDDLQRAKDLLNTKLSHDSYNNGGQTDGNRGLVQQIDDKSSFWSTDEKGILSAVQHMSETDQKRYREDPKFKEDLDKAVSSTLGHSVEGFAAQRILEHVMKGEGAKDDILGKLAVRMEGDKETPAMLAELEASMKDDPGLRERILHPKNDEETKFSQQFEQMARFCYGGDYSKYVEPLLKNGSLPFAEKAKLYDGFWSNDTKGLYDAIATATPEEKQAIAADPHKLLPFLTTQQSELAANIAKQNGEMQPVDKMRAAILGMSGDKDAIRELGTNLKPEERAKLVHDYQIKYGSSLISDLDDKLSGQDRTEAERNFRDLPDTARAAFNAARNEDLVSNDGIGRSFVRHWDGTADMSRDDLNQYAAAMEDYSRVYKDMPVAQSEKMASDLTEAVDLYRKSKGAAADAIVDGTIIVAGVGGAAFTGGVSLGLIATTGLAGAAFKIGTKAAIQGADYDSSHIVADGATGAIDAATMVVGPGEVAKILRIGGKAAATATDLALVEAGNLAKAGGREILKESAQATLKKELTNEVSTALAHGAKEVDEKTIQRLAEKYAASPEDVTAVKELLTSNLNKAVATESSNALKGTLREVALNSGAGSAAGGGSAMVRGFSEWDNSKSVDANLLAIAEQTAMGSAMGAAMGGGATVGFKALGKGFSVARMAVADHMKLTNEGVDIMSGLVKAEDHVKLDAHGRVVEIQGIQTTKVEYHDTGDFAGQPSKVKMELGTTFENVGENKWRMVSHEHPNGLDIDGNVHVMANGEVHIKSTSGDTEIHYPNGLITFHEQASGNVRTITDTGHVVAVETRSGNLAMYVHTGEGAFEGMELKSGRSIIREENGSGWLLKETADGPTTRFEGDVTVDKRGFVHMKPKDGGIEQVLLPDGASMRMDSVAHKPSEIIYADGTKMSFEYDADGKISRYVDKNGNTHTRAQDSLPNYFESVSPDGKGRSFGNQHLTMSDDGVLTLRRSGAEVTFHTDGRKATYDTDTGAFIGETVPEGYAREGRSVDTGGRPLGGSEARERRSYIDKHFDRFMGGSEGDVIRQVSRELSDVKAIGADGKATSAYESLMSDPNLSDAQKKNILRNMGQVREHFASFRSGDYMHNDPEVNWIHTQGEMAKALEVGRANHLTPTELEDSLLASMYSDSVKFAYPPPEGATANFFTHHLDGANAAQSALERQGFPPDRINRIVGSIKAHQISPPQLMGELYYFKISSSIENAIKTGKVSEAEGNHLRSVLQDMTEVGKDGKSRIRAISDVRNQPREVGREGHMQLIFSEDQRKVMEYSGLDTWTVPYDTKLDPNFRQLSDVERQAALSKQRVHQAVIDADGIDNYATTGGVSKFVAIRGPETSFKDPMVWDSIRSVDKSYIDGYSLMSPEARKIADLNWKTKTVQTDMESGPLRSHMDDWLRSQGRDPSQPIPYYNTELKYPTSAELKPGERSLPGLTEAETRDYLFAKEIRAEMVDALRREARVDGSLPGTFEAMNKRNRYAEQFTDRSPSELKLPGKNPQDIAPGDTYISPDRSVTAVRGADGSLHVTNSADNSFRKYDSQNRIVEVRTPESSRAITYTPSGLVRDITTIDAATGKEMVITRHVDGSGWTEASDGPNGRILNRVSGHDLVVDADGTVKGYHASDVHTEQYRRYNNDGSIDTVRPTGRVEYVHADYAAEKQRFNDVLAAKIADQPKRAERFNHLVEEFERNAASSERQLTENDKALLYKQLSRLLADSPTSAIPLAQRINLAEQALDHSAHPWHVDQGTNSTCNVTTVEHRNYWRNPDKNVQVLADLAETGRYVFNDGRVAELRNVEGELKPDYSSRNSMALQEKSRGTGLNQLKYDGQRDYSSQLIETTMANYVWAERTEIINGQGRKLIASDYQMRFDSKGKPVGVVDHNNLTVLSDKDGNALMGYTPGQQYYDQFKRPIKVAEDRLVYDSNGRATGFVDKMDDLKMAYDANGKPLKEISSLDQGAEVYDKDGNILVRHTAKGEMHYGKAAVNGKDEERVMIDLNGKQVRFMQNDGKPLTHPSLNSTYYRDISRGINDSEPRDFIVSLGNQVGEGPNRVTISDEESFVKALKVMEAEDNLPAIMVVNSSKPPFSEKASFDSDGNFSGWHVINVHSVEHVRDSNGVERDIVHFTNQWGSKADHLKDGIDAHIMFESMKDTPKIAVKPKPLPVDPPPVDEPGRLRKLWNRIKPYVTRNKTSAVAAKPPENPAATPGDDL